MFVFFFPLSRLCFFFRFRVCVFFFLVVVFISVGPFFPAVGSSVAGFFDGFFRPSGFPVPEILTGFPVIAR